MTPHRRKILTLALAGPIVGCGKNDSPPTAITDLKASAGDSRVELTWSGDASEFWAFSASDASLTLDNWTTLANPKVVRNVRSPASVTGLTNGVTYYFLVNGRNNGGQGSGASNLVSATPRAGGDTWTRGSTIGSARLLSASGSELFALATNAAGEVYISSDLITWSRIDVGTSRLLHAGTFGGGYYILVGDGGVIARSDVGNANWALQFVDVVPTLRDVMYQSGGFIAVGDRGAVAISINGNNWSARDPGVTANLTGVTQGGTRTVISGEGGTLLYSDNNSQFVAATSPVAAQWRATAYGAGRFVVVGDSGRIASSADGITWELAASPTSVDLRGVRFGVSRFIASGRNGTLLRSDDGITWSPVSSGISTDIGRMDYVFGRYVGLSDAGVWIQSR